MCQTRPVGQKQSNALGIHDMSGNVREWVNDWLGPYPSTAQTDPAGPSTGQYRVLRGGSFSWPRLASRASFREYHGADAVGADHGFRVARNP